MGVVISPDSAYGIELARWNTPRNKPVRNSNDEIVRDPITKEVIMGMGAIGIEEYPKMLFKAKKHPRSGKPTVGDVLPNPMYFTGTPQEFERECMWIESFNASCQMKVYNVEEERKAANNGWCVTQDGALEVLESYEKEFARIAAEEAFKAQRMSEKARAEFEAAGQMTHEHVVDLKPKRKRGRPSKGVQPVTGSESDPSNG